MKIGCVYSLEDYFTENEPLLTFTAIPFGIAHIATALKHAGFDSGMLVLTSGSRIPRMLESFVAEVGPRLFCLTAVSSQFPLVCRVARAIKRIDPAIHVVIGGHHATLNPESTMSNPCFDALCVGEGERAIVEYATQLKEGRSPGGIANLWIRNRETGRVEKNPTAPFLRELDHLPPIDRGLWDGFVADRSRMASILVGRGCPYRCSYCSNHALARIATGRYVRFRSVPHILAELEQLTGLYPQVRTVYLEVETLSVDLPYAHRLLEGLARFNRGRESPLKFGANLTLNANLLNGEELLHALKKANFDFINIGLESGSEQVRNKILRRPKYDNPELVRFCRALRGFGLHLNLFVLIGIPGETYRDYLETVACARRCEPDHVYLSIFYPYPGTDLFQRALDMKLIRPGIVNPTSERAVACLNLPGFPRWQIQREFCLFPWRLYRGRKPMYQIAAMCARQFVLGRPVLNNLYRRILGSRVVNAARKRFSTFFR